MISIGKEKKREEKKKFWGRRFLIYSEEGAFTYAVSARVQILGKEPETFVSHKVEKHQLIEFCIGTSQKSWKSICQLYAQQFLVYPRSLTLSLCLNC